MKIYINDKTVFSIGKFSILWNYLEKKKFDKFFKDYKIKGFSIQNVNDLNEECKSLINYFIEFCNEHQLNEEVELFNSISNERNSNYIDLENYTALTETIP